MRSARPRPSRRNRKAFPAYDRAVAKAAFLTWNFGTASGPNEFTIELYVVSPRPGTVPAVTTVDVTALSGITDAEVYHGPGAGPLERAASVDLSVAGVMTVTTTSAVAPGDVIAILPGAGLPAVTKAGPLPADYSVVAS